MSQKAWLQGHWTLVCNGYRVFANPTQWVYSRNRASPEKLILL
jgi:hypothetical protein